jgi:hypothetical protein
MAEHSENVLKNVGHIFDQSRLGDDISNELSALKRKCQSLIVEKRFLAAQRSNARVGVCGMIIH